MSLPYLFLLLPFPSFAPPIHFGHLPRLEFQREEYQEESRMSPDFQVPVLFFSSHSDCPVTLNVPLNHPGTIFFTTKAKGLN